MSLPLDLQRQGQVLGGGVLALPELGLGRRLVSCVRHGWPTGSPCWVLSSGRKSRATSLQKCERHAKAA
eukprot:14945157-Alexandrium_andersonii.AAC.1